MTNACSGRGPALVLVANTRGARIVSRDAITTGSVGIQVALDLSEEYSGLAVTVVFRAGEEQADWAVIGSEPIMVPPQCLQEPGVMLYIGVYASDGDGSKVIPTVWASAGAVRQGVEPSGYDPVGPAPSWAAQVQQAAAEAVETANSVRADANAGAFDGDPGPEGPAGYSPSARVTQTASGATITVTDQSGTTTADISNGAPGEPGQTGPIGPTGEDGFSPTVDVQPITGGHEVTITDADGAHSFEVMDGDPAEPGSITDAMLAPDGIKPQVAQLFGNQLTGTLSGTIATAADAYAAPPMALTVDGASTQAGTPTPDAPVPILSVDELALVCAGKNLLPSARTGRSSYNPAAGTTFNPTSSAPSGTITDNGDGTFVMTAPSGWAAATLYTEPLPSGTYHIKAAFSGSTPRVSVGTVRARDMIFVGTPTNFTSSDFIDKTYTFNEPHIITVYVGSSSAGTVTITQPQIELSSTATAYEPYIVVTAPIDLQGHELRSLPDGTQDQLNLTYDRPSKRAGWAWYKASMVQRCKRLTRAIADMVDVPVSSSLIIPGWQDTGISDGFTTPSNIFSSTKCYCNIKTGKIAEGYQTQNRLVLWDNYGYGFTTAAEWKAAYPDLTFVLDYPLTTPVTTTLDLIELPTLPAPTVTVWCDGGSAQPTYSMQYVQDTNLVVHQLTAETAIAYASIAAQDGPTATASHAIGTYLTMGGTLYKVTQAIAVGETIAAGTNVTATTVMAELLARTA